MRNYFKTVGKLAALVTVLCVLGTMPTWAADDVSTMLFGPAKKISAQKSSPLIPKISKTEPQKKNISPQINSKPRQKPQQRPQTKNLRKKINR